MHSGQLAASLTTLDEAVKLNPKALDYTWTLLGWARYRAGNVNEATELWERVRASNPDATGDRISLVNHYFRHGREAEAHELVGEILASNPRYNAQLAAIWLGATGLPMPIVEDFVGTLMKAGIPPPPGAMLDGAPGAPTDPRAAAAAQGR